MFGQSATLCFLFENNQSLNDTIHFFAYKILHLFATLICTAFNPRSRADLFNIDFYKSTNEYKKHSVQPIHELLDVDTNSLFIFCKRLKKETTEEETQDLRGKRLINSPIKIPR